jgi:hypothetical protein
MDEIPSSNNAKGEPESLKNTVSPTPLRLLTTSPNHYHQLLETGASHLQNLAPPNRICAHLNAFHVYVSDPSRISEANHYCAHVNDEVRQCILYDSPLPNARLIGVEYMVSSRIYEALDPEERKLWHSHVFEVKSGMLIMPTPKGVPEAVWEVAEKKEMEEVVELYGKVYQLWQVDRGDEVPLGKPELMTSFTKREQFDFENVVGERDRRFGVDSAKKAEGRKDIREPTIHEDADWLWSKKKDVKEDQGGLWKKKSGGEDDKEGNVAEVAQLRI